jgi:hypothetical protein
MANSRIITSAIWEDDWFGQLGFFEQALWIGLFSKVRQTASALQFKRLRPGSRGLLRPAPNPPAAGAGLRAGRPPPISPCWGVSGRPAHRPISAETWRPHLPHLAEPGLIPLISCLPIALSQPCSSAAAGGGGSKAGPSAT